MNSQPSDGNSIIQSLIATNDDVRQLLKSGINNGLWLVNLKEPEITHTTDNFWQTFALDPSSVSNRSIEWQKLAHPDDLRAGLKYFSEVARGNTDKYDIVGRFFKNEEIIWIRCRAIALKTDQGATYALLGMHTDITQEIENQKGGDNNQTLFQDFFLLSNQLFCIGHVRGEFLRVNLAFKKILDYYPNDILGRTFESIVHPEDWPETRKKLLSIVHGEPITNFTVRIQHRNGDYRIIEWKAIYKNELLYGSGEDITNKVKEERKHMRVRRMLEQTNEVARVGGWEMDLTQNKLYWSSVTKAIHKVNDDFKPSTEDAIQFYKDGKSRERIREALTSLIKEQKPFACELQIVDTEGKEVWVFVTGKGEFVQDRCLRMYGSIQDISERKITEAKLLTSESKFRSFVENLNDIIFTLNKEGIFQYISPNSEEILGYPISQLIGSNFSSGVHEEDKKACFHYIEKAFKNEPYRDSINYRVMHADGKWRWYAAKGKIFQSGDETLFLGVARDVTKEKSIEESLMNSEKQAFDLAKSYKNILDSQNVFIVKTDMLGIYTYANEYFKEFFGFGENVIGTNSMTTIHPEDLQKTFDVVQKCLEVPNIPHEIVIRKPTQEGTMKGGRWEFRAITNSSGQPVEILCVGYDISEQLENLERAQTLLKITSDQNFKLKSFSHIVSHNIRSHSANLISLADFISESKDEEEKSNFINMLKISTQKLEETIRNLSDIINIEESTDRTKEPLKLHHEVNKTIQSLNASIFQLQAEIINEVPEDLIIHAVPTYLDSILLNIFSNAIRYRSPDRNCKVYISSQKITNFTVLSITDNGLGIDLSKHAHKLFGMYKTFHGNEDARGFGLYITKTQIEAMGGKIDVESEVGVGTTFKIYFREKN